MFKTLILLPLLLLFLLPLPRNVQGLPLLKATCLYYLPGHVQRGVQVRESGPLAPSHRQSVIVTLCRLNVLLTDSSLTSGTSIRGRRVRHDPGDISISSRSKRAEPSRAEPSRNTLSKNSFPLMFHFVCMRVCLLCRRVCLLSVWFVEACGEAQYAVSVLTAPGSIGAVSDRR